MFIPSTFLQSIEFSLFVLYPFLQTLREKRLFLEIEREKKQVMIGERLGCVEGGEVEGITFKVENEYKNYDKSHVIEFMWGGEMGDITVQKCRQIKI